MARSFSRLALVLIAALWVGAGCGPLIPQVGGAPSSTLTGTFAASKASCTITHLVGPLTAESGQIFQLTLNPEDKTGVSCSNTSGAQNPYMSVTLLLPAAATGSYTTSSTPPSSTNDIVLILPDGDACGDQDVGLPWSADISSVGQEINRTYEVHGTIQGQLSCAFGNGTLDLKF